jgi:hypothetical protein
LIPQIHPSKVLQIVARLPIWISTWTTQPMHRATHTVLNLQVKHLNLWVNHLN